MRVAIVNDVMIAVEVLRRVLAPAPDIEVAWVARDGAEAVARCAEDLPDVVLMDLIMPVMDGVEATRRIMQDSPCAILVVTSTVDGNAAKVFEAMGHGALDAVGTPVLGPAGDVGGGDALLAKLATLRRLLGNPGSKSPPLPAGDCPQMVLLGSSTGGPKALADVLAGFPAGFDLPLVIVQHVDVEFAAGLAEWLTTQCLLPVRVAREGAAPERGVALLAASNDHLVLTPDRRFTYTPDPLDCPYRPSVDAMFRSAVRNWPTPGVAALLTGMGRDGAEGLLALRQAGWHTVAQDQATSVVYGMPKAAADLGGAMEVLPIDRVAPALLARLGRAVGR